VAQCIVIGHICGRVCVFVCVLPRQLENACIDPHQIGFVGKGSDHLQLIKFWPSREGVCGGAKFFGSALLQPARSVCVFPSAFFIRDRYLLFVVKLFYSPPPLASRRRPPYTWTPTLARFPVITPLTNIRSHVHADGSSLVITFVTRSDGRNLSSHLHHIRVINFSHAKSSLHCHLQRPPEHHSLTPGASVWYYH